MIWFAVKLPLASRLTIAFAIVLLLGATVQFSASVPIPDTGEPVTVKSELGAVSPIFVAVPGKICPEAKVIWPLGPIFNPVSAAAFDPAACSKFRVPLALAVLLPAGSACQRKF